MWNVSLAILWSLEAELQDMVSSRCWEKVSSGQKLWISELKGRRITRRLIKEEETSKYF